MTVNQADDTGFTSPLIRALQRHVETLTVPGPLATENDRAEPAVAWVYLSTLVAWAEDHQLIDPWLRTPATARQDTYLTESSDGARGWLARAIHALGSAHPSAWCLLDPRYTRMRDGRPPETACRALLDWWRRTAPSFAYDVDVGPTSLSGWMPGDLMQHLSADRRKKNALAQTPWWVADAILDQTLRPAANEFPNRPLQVIDPTCGTGHFLVRAVDRLWELYTTGTMTPYVPGADPIEGWIPVGPVEAVRRILGGLHGVELDPLTAAVARLRITVTIASKLAGDKPFQLARVSQDIRPRVIVGDSLLMGKIPWGEYQQIHPGLAEIYESERHLFGWVSWPDDSHRETGPEPPPVVLDAAIVAELATVPVQLDMFAEPAP